MKQGSAAARVIPPANAWGGDWSRIEFQDSSNDANSLIDNTVICYGSNWYVGAVELIGASPTIQNTTFCNNELHAILADLKSLPKLSNNTFSNNGTNGLTYRGGTISSDTAWEMTDTAYFILDNVAVGVGKTLTINPGVVVKFQDGRALIVQGALKVLGTPESKVYFTSKRDDTVGDPGDTNNDGATLPGRGDWSRIEFQDSSDDANSLIDNTVICYGSNSSTGVWLTDGNNTVVVSLNKKMADQYAFTVQPGMCDIPDTSGNTFSPDGLLEYAASGKSYATVTPGCAWNPATARAQPYVHLIDNGTYLLNVSVNGVALTQLSATHPNTPVFLGAGQNVTSAANGFVSI